MLRTWLTVLAAWAALASPTSAQDYPSKPIKIVVGFAAGGLADLMGRFFGEYVTRETGQTVVVENRTGAAGTLALDAVAKSAPDGYTLGVVIAGQLIINPFVQKSMPLDVTKDLVAVAPVVDAPQLIAMSTEALPAKDVREFIALAKAKPGELSYGSPGHGSFPHLAVAEFARAAGIKLTHVPYRGNAPAITDLIAGRLHIVSSSIASLQAGIDAGKLRLLVAATDKRLGYAPDVPAADEAGLKDYRMSAWVGVIAPAATPKPVVARVHALVMGMLKDAATQKRLADNFLDPKVMSQEAFADYVKSEHAKWRDIVKEAGVEAK